MQKDLEWYLQHGCRPAEEVFRAIENQQIHIVNSAGDKRTATAKEIEELYPDYQLDKEWYKEHGYKLSI